MQDIRGEWILRFLMQKGMSYGAVGGGMPTVTRESAMNTLSAIGCKGFEFNFVFAYVNGLNDEETITKMQYEVWGWASLIAFNSDWDVKLAEEKGKETTRLCSMAALKDKLIPSRVLCDRCDGRGVNLRGRACKYCAEQDEGGCLTVGVGSGLKKVSGTLYSKELEIGRTQWYKNWNRYHEELKKELDNIIILTARKAQQAIEISRKYDLLEAV